MENNTSPTPEQPADSNETIFTQEQFALEGYDKHIRQARNAIFAAAIILALSLVFIMVTSGGYEYMWVDMLLWGGFIAGFVVLGFWTKKKPYTAIICALTLYGLFILLNAFLDISTIYKGIIIKVIIIVTLVKGLRDAKEAQQMREQLS